MAEVARKYLAHYIDANGFPGSTGTGTNYVRLGDDLEEYNIELNPDVESTKNIKGESRVKHSGYEVSSEVDPFYADFENDLFEPLWDIANERKTGAACKTTAVDVLFNEDGTVHSAYREDVYCIPTSNGGDTSGVQIPFQVHYAGNRTSGTWTSGTKTFTPASE